jgi:hypothetical protein
VLAATMSACFPTDSVAAYIVLATNQGSQLRLLVLTDDVTGGSTLPTLSLPADGVMRRSFPMGSDRGTILIYDTSCRLVSKQPVRSGYYELTILADDSVTVERLPTAPDPSAGVAYLGQASASCPGSSP